MSDKIYFQMQKKYYINLHRNNFIIKKGRIRQSPHPSSLYSYVDCDDTLEGDGTDVNLSPICCSATADASWRIFSVSSPDTSVSTLNSPPANESIIKPLSVCVMEFSSESASGMNLPSDDLSPFIVATAGPIAIIASPKSCIVVRRSCTCSNAILAFPSILVTFLISASSFDRTRLVAASCCCIAATIRLKS